MAYEKGQQGPALWYAPAYQVSSIPYATASLSVPAVTDEPLEIKFPFVTKIFTVRNDGTAPIRVGFTRNGVKAVETNNYIYLEPGISFEGEFKISKLYFLSHNSTVSTASCVAGLTTIEAFDPIILANWSGSLWGVGVG